MKSNNIYTNIILEHRFCARARLAIARDCNEKKEAPAKLLAHVKEDFFAGLKWEYGAEIADTAVSILDEYPLTSCMCPYDFAERTAHNTWLTWAEWSACGGKLCTLRKWRLIDLEPSACDDGIYLAINCRAEAIPLINHIINREEV